MEEAVYNESVDVIVVGPSPKRQQLGVIRQARSFRQTPIVSTACQPH